MVPVSWEIASIRSFICAWRVVVASLRVQTLAAQRPLKRDVDGRPGAD